MSLKKQKRNEIRDYILWNIRNHPSDIVRFAQKKFELSRPAILRYIHNLKNENIIDVRGSTKNIRYSLKPLQAHTCRYNSIYSSYGNLSVSCR